jgi:hypothetical protein
MDPTFSLHVQFQQSVYRGVLARMLGRAGSKESCCSIYHITVSTLTPLGTCRDHLYCLGVWCHQGSKQLVTRGKGVMKEQLLRSARRTTGHIRADRYTRACHSSAEMRRCVTEGKYVHTWETHSRLR